ncbi:MAG TPA: metal ABC transporter permease [Anaerolineaceae bacterium]|nr:metal ABC transporter permease [Anaerolineaceae bacterium]HOR84750.1 metal ABC transporter permease [Anaerolineaceae bacterium]HPL43876.1 metal ABC transporter permease [Anaerolineaceae bacterium]
MTSFLNEILSYEFMRNALLAGVIVSAACGIIGTLVVLNRIVFISGGIAHAAYGGVGIAYFLGLNPVWGAVVFSLASSLAMGYVHRKEKARADTIIGVMWALGMALGIIFVSLSPGYKADLMSYLFGSILAVSAADLRLMLVIVLAVLIFVLVFYRLLLAISFDETFSTVRNVPVGFVYMAMIVLIGLTVVISMRVVGLILVIALLTIPPAIANLFVQEMRGIMFLSSALSLVFTISGLLISYTLNLPSGAVIILVASLAYGLAAALRGILTWSTLKKESAASRNDF